MTYTLVNGTKQDANEVQTNFNDLVSFLNGSVLHRDGSLAMTGALDMGGFGVTNAGPIAATALALTGALTTTSTIDGRDVATDGAKLDGIEAGATADQTAAQILTSIKTVDGSGSGLDADLLDGQHASAFAAASHGTHLSGATPDTVTHDYMQFKYAVDLDAGPTNIGTGITPLSKSLTVPSAALMLVFWQMSVKRTSAGTGNTLTVLPRDDGVNMDVSGSPNGINLDALVPNLNDIAYISGLNYKVLGSSNTSTWSVYVTKSGGNTFDFDGGQMVVLAIPI